jgi:hypothetical protein
MEIRDLIVTPFYIVLVYVIAYVVRPYVCDRYSYAYFFPALTVKVVGAIALGFIYQFYYNGGDTFNYHTWGSRVIWEQFVQNPLDGLRLIFLPVDSHPLELQHFASSRIVFYHDPASYFVIRIAAFFDLFTFSSYSATAVLFAVAGFTGLWMMFMAFYKIYPLLMNSLALSILFIPSVFFWGSGILKDTVVMAALGASVLLVQVVFMERKGNALQISMLLLCLVVMYIVKKYVLLCFVPAAILWVYIHQLLAIRNMVLRILMVPLLFGMLVVSSYYSVRKIGEGDYRYSIERLALTAQITANDIRYYSGRDAGSGYSIGTLDGTFGGTFRLAPQAVNVSLFRPYLWEVKNPLMLIAAIESAAILVLTLVILIRNPLRFFRSLREPSILFCMSFAITFAFAVGVSTYNFGTLVRYKIPMLPFYVVGLVLIANYVRSERNRLRFDSVE